MKRLRYTGEKARVLHYHEHGEDKSVELKPDGWYHLPSDAPGVKFLVSEGLLTLTPKLVEEKKEEVATEKKVN